VASNLRGIEFLPAIGQLKSFAALNVQNQLVANERNSYTTAELNFLHEVAENYSITYLYKKYKAEAKLQGWVIRNKHSIEAKLQKLGLQLEAVFKSAFYFRCCTNARL
jgi:hypothetical protein